MTDLLHNAEAAAGSHPDGSSGNQLRAGAMKKPIPSIAPSADRPTAGDQMEMEFRDEIPASAYDGVEQAAANTEPNWRDWVLHEIEVLAATGQEFTNDDLRKVVGEPDHPNRWGAAVRVAKGRGLIEATGAVRRSTTVSRRASLVQVWRGKRADDGQVAA